MLTAATSISYPVKKLLHFVTKCSNFLISQNISMNRINPFILLLMHGQDIISLSVKVFDIEVPHTELTIAVGNPNSIPSSQISLI